MTGPRSSAGTNWRPGSSGVRSCCWTSARPQSTSPGTAPARSTPIGELRRPCGRCRPAPTWSLLSRAILRVCRRVGARAESPGLPRPWQRASVGARRQASRGCSMAAATCLRTPYAPDSRDSSRWSASPDAASVLSTLTRRASVRSRSWMRQDLPVDRRLLAETVSVQPAGANSITSGSCHGRFPKSCHAAVRTRVAPAAPAKRPPSSGRAGGVSIAGRRILCSETCAASGLPGHEGNMSAEPTYPGVLSRRSRAGSGRSPG